MSFIPNHLCFSAVSARVALGLLSVIHGPVWGQSDSSKLESRPIQGFVVKSNDPDEQVRIQNMLGKPPRRYSLSAVERQLLRLLETNRYHRLAASYDMSRGLVSFDVGVYPRLGRISVQLMLGSELSEMESESLSKELERVVGVVNDEPITVDQFPEIRQRLLDRIGDRGFRNPSVVLALRDNNSGDIKDLQVSVSSLGRMPLRAVSIPRQKDRGVSSASSDLLDIVARRNSRLGTAQAKREIHGSQRLVPIDYDPREWRLTLEEWAQYWRFQGYLDLRYDVIFDPANGLVIDFELGSQLDLQFQGNVAFWERDLRAAVLDRNQKTGLRFSLKDAEKILRRIYFEKGYADLQIEFRDEKIDIYRRRVTVLIQEGPQYFLGQVQINGIPPRMEAESDWIVDEWQIPMKTMWGRVYFYPEKIDSSLPGFVRLLQDYGYMGARIVRSRWTRDKKRAVADLILDVQPGPLVRIRKVSVEGNVVLSEQELDQLIDLRTGDPVSPTRIEAVSDRLTEAYLELGFLNVEVSRTLADVVKMQREDEVADVVYQIRPGPQIRLGEILVSNPGGKTREKVIRRESSVDTLSPAEPWRLSGQRLFEDRLLGLGIFASAEFQSLSPRSDVFESANRSDFEIQERDLRISIQERAAGSVEFGPGFRSDLGVLGFVEYAYRNLGGWNRGIVLRGQVSRKIQDFQFLEQRLVMTYLEPYIFEQRIRFRFRSSYDKRDFTVRDSVGSQVAGFNLESTTIDFLTDFAVGRYWRLYQSLYTLEIPNYFSVQDRDVLGTNQQKTRIASVGASVVFDNRDHFFLPTRGWLYSFGGEFGSPVFGGADDAHYWNAKTSATTYFKASRWDVLAVQGTYAYLQSLNPDQAVPLSKRYFVGGQNSVRAFPSNSLGEFGSDMRRQELFEVKAEWRRSFFNDLGLAIFWDGGIVDSFEASSSGFRNGFGLGLRYITPVGPVSLELAFPIRPLPQEERFRILLAVGAF